MDGGTTNKSFLAELLQAAEVVHATADTGWVDRTRADRRLTAVAHAGIALAAAAIGGYEQTESAERARLWDSGRGGRPYVHYGLSQVRELKLGGRPYQVSVACRDAGHYRVRIEGGGGETAAFDAARERLDAHLSRLTVNRRVYRLVTAIHGSVHVVEVDGITHRVMRDEGGVLRAPAPALVVSAPVAVGTKVSAGSQVLVLESMKMETVIRAPFDARVRELLVSVGSQVGSGAPLARLEPTGTQDVAVRPGPAAAPVDLMIPEEAGTSAAERAAAALKWLRGLVLGFDLGGEPAADTIARYLAVREAAVAEGAPARHGGTGPRDGVCRHRRTVFGAAVRSLPARPAGAVPHLPAEPGRGELGHDG